MIQTEQIAQKILEYLKQRPQACDTLEGVARWWMMSQQLSEAVEQIQQVLEQLRATGQIKERLGADGRIVYSVCNDAP